jgi:hypothetical protein
MEANGVSTFFDLLLTDSAAPSRREGVETEGNKSDDSSDFCGIVFAFLFSRNFAELDSC